MFQEMMLASSGGGTVTHYYATTIGSTGRVDCGFRPTAILAEAMYGSALSIIRYDASVSTSTFKQDRGNAANYGTWPIESSQDLQSIDDTGFNLHPTYFPQSGCIAIYAVKD